MPRAAKAVRRLCQELISGHCAVDADGGAARRSGAPLRMVMDGRGQVGLKQHSGRVTVRRGRRFGRQLGAGIG